MELETRYTIVLTENEQDTIKNLYLRLNESLYDYNTIDVARIIEAIAEKEESPMLNYNETIYFEYEKER